MSLKIPRITWGSGFTGSLYIGYPLDSATSYSKPREGSVTKQYISGQEDAWSYPVDYVLEGMVKWIPTADTVAPASASGWDGNLGWRAFLEWARDKNQFRFIPDSTVLGTYILSYLAEDDGAQAPTVLEDGTRGYQLKIRNPASQSYDGM